MKRKLFPVLLTAEAVCCIILSLFGGLFPNVFTTVAAFPLEQTAYALRWLSLSGEPGNIAAIVLYISISLIPALFLLKKNRHWEDLLLALLSIQLFLSLYCMINPGLINRHMHVSLGVEFERAMMGGTFYSILVSYWILRLVRAFFDADRPRLVSYLRILLYGLCVLLIYLVFYNGLTELLLAISALRDGNTGNEHLLAASYVFLVLRHLVDSLPYLLDIFVVLAACKLLDTERNSETSVLAAETLSKTCRATLTITTVSTVIYHVLQLLFLQHIFHSSVTVDLPLFSLLFMLGVLLLAQYAKENKALQDDNDLFI